MKNLLLPRSSKFYFRIGPTSFSHIVMQNSKLGFTVAKVTIKKFVERFRNVFDSGMFKCVATNDDVFYLVIVFL